MAENELMLVGAVQDLYDLYVRLGPCGPYRLGLFSDQAGTAADWPSALSRRAVHVDTLIRGVTCLLANKLTDAAFPVIPALWASIEDLERALARGKWREPAYYQYLTQELVDSAACTDARAYRLFGEVLAVYLDTLCALRGPESSSYTVEISRLRALILRSGEHLAEGHGEESASAGKRSAAQS